MDAINLLEKAGLVDALWSPRVVGELNDVQVKVARIHGFLRCDSVKPLARHVHRLLFHATTQVRSFVI